MILLQQAPWVYSANDLKRIEETYLNQFFSAMNHSVHTVSKTATTHMQAWLDAAMEDALKDMKKQLKRGRL